MDLHITFLPLVPTSYPSYPGLYNFLYLKLVVVFINLLYRSSAAMLVYLFHLVLTKKVKVVITVQCNAFQVKKIDVMTMMSPT